MPRLRLRGKVAPQSCVLEKIGSEGHHTIVKGATSLVGSSCCGVNISTSSIPTLADGDARLHPWHGREPRGEGGRGGGGGRRRPDVVHWKTRVCVCRWEGKGGREEVS